MHVSQAGVLCSLSLFVELHMLLAVTHPDSTARDQSQPIEMKCVELSITSLSLGENKQKELWR